MEVLAIPIAAFIASVAWIYQRGWERQERRLMRYERLMDLAKYFADSGGENKKEEDIKKSCEYIQKREEFIAEVSRLWISAPPDVVRAGEAFLKAVQTGKEAERALGEYVIAMRKDSYIRSVIFPCSCHEPLRASEFTLWKANKGPDKDTQ